MIIGKLERSMPDITLKVVICGDFAVGKTTFVRSFLNSDNRVLKGYKPTIGVDIGRKTFKIDSKRIILQIWDLSGQQAFKAIRPQFYKRSDGSILVFDVTRKKSFDHLTLWLEELLEQTGQIPVVLVGNKIDLKEKCAEVISSQEAQAFANHISTLTGKDTPYIEASATERQNNLEPFVLLGRLLLPQS